MEEVEADVPTKILFKAGTTFEGTLELESYYAKEASPLIVSTYGETEEVPYAKIIAPNDGCSIILKGDNVRISNFECTSNGGDEGATKNWGESGVSFSRVYNANLGYNEETQPFFKEGYQYIKLDFYAESSVYSIDFRHGNSVADGWLQEIKADQEFTSSVFILLDANGNRVNKWTVGEWYTLIIKPTAGLMLFVQTNAETSTSEAPVMYVKNATYLAEFPFAN